MGTGEADDVVSGRSHDRQRAVLMSASGQLRGRLRAVSRGRRQEGLTHVFIVTDEDRLFEAMVRQLPEHVDPVRLYSSYLRNFEIEAVRAAR